ncbi:thiamine-phosphate kinase [Enemella dayhoffiae]|uniref:Thiamine-monophosphate kinase n=1 Tax=Enemella dayhoffiae TaxID=2016507 RepID=A0A255H2N4_9ACTN|nr:thiamine-phosphate kinase [Enemella dayhoffiae]OYO22058.1 thiamine-phosphate kinase [Enemella dayhoffiae]
MPAADKPAGSLDELGEFALIEQITADLETSAAVRLGPGDDAAVIRPDGDVVVSTDTLVAGVHFRTDWSLAHEVGQRAVAQSVADLEAMGARPVALVAAFTAPGDLPAAWAKQCAQGMRLEAARSRSVLVGGDVTSGRDITITVTVLGDLQGRPPVIRGGARPGDVVAVCGRLGWSAAGLAVLRRGFRSPRAVVEAYKVPEVPYGQGVIAATAGATAMIDISDGLLADLGHVARASGVRVDLERERFTVPEPIQAVAAATGADPWSFLLGGGEDHGLVATFPDGAHLPADWHRIGGIAEGEPEVLIDGGLWSGESGWSHFGR